MGDSENKDQNNDSENSENSQNFYGRVLSKTGPTLGMIVVSTIIYLFLFPIGVNYDWLPIAVVLIGVLKSFFIVKVVYKQLSKMLGESHYLKHVLFLFGLVISMIVFSYASDYFALYMLEPAHFKVNNFVSLSKLHTYYQTFYFSFISYSTIGFGDMVPASVYAKFLVMLETALYFFVIVFGTANINRLEIKDEN
jgi:hypothetical protein